MSLMAAALAAADAVRSRPAGTRWLLSPDNDADGLCAAAVCYQALRRIGHRATVRPSRDKTEAHYRALFAEEADGHILLDKGTSHLATLAERGRATGRPVVVLDHHNLPAAGDGDAVLPDGVHLVNPRAVGLDGSRDASASTTTVAFALALVGDEALRWAPAGLVGAIGDWQHHGGWRGWNRELLERCRAAGLLRAAPQPGFPGADLAEALARAQPAIPGLRGDAGASRAFLEALAVDPGADVDALDAERASRLVSAVALRHLGAGAPGALPHLVHDEDVDVRLGAGLRRVYRVVDACGREGRPDAGIAYLLGDPGGTAEAVALFGRYRDALAAGLEAIRRDGTATRRALQVAWTARHEYTGNVGGIAMTVLLPDRTRPLAVLAHRPDGLVQVSTRGTEAQVRAGMDLGRACRDAAAAVGAEGGGHPVAAGAAIPAASAEAFLAALDERLAMQGFAGKVAA